MASKSAIEWTDATWNPIVGCTIVSPGCTNCYAMKMAARIEAMNHGRHAPHAPTPKAIPASLYDGLTKPSKGGPVWTGDVRLADDRTLTAPLRWNRPRKIFVNSMGDLFHESVPDEWIDRVFAVMALAPQHTFQVLTKRSKRMREYVSSRLAGHITRPISRLTDELKHKWKSSHHIYIDHKYFFSENMLVVDPQYYAGTIRMIDFTNGVIIPNIWLGVSAEDQPRADERRDDLASLAAQGWITFVSYEPALKLVDWTGWDFLKQLISGGESGPNACPSHPDWHRAARDFCAAHGIAYFFKQWGAWVPVVDRERDDPDWRKDYSSRYGERASIRWLNLAGGRGFHGERFHVMGRVGKANAGRLLDGVEHNGMPS